MAKATAPASTTADSPAKAPPAAKAKRRVLIVDDHPIFRDGITQLLNFQPDLEVCGGVSSARQALAAVEQLKPDVLTVDISIQGSDGIELLKSIRAQYPNLPALMVSSHDENVYAERALRAGARGYIMKDVDSTKILDALRRILDGALYLSDAISGRLLNTFLNGRGGNAATSSVEQLSDREIEVFRALGNGKSTREIAWALNLSVKTVETHRAHIKTKLDLQTSNELIRAAVEWVSRASSG